MNEHIYDLASRPAVPEADNDLAAQLGNGEETDNATNQPRTKLAPTLFAEPHVFSCGSQGNPYIAEWIPTGRPRKLKTRPPLGGGPAGMMAGLCKLITWSAIRLAAARMAKPDGRDPRLAQARQVIESQEFIPAEVHAARVQFTGGVGIHFETPRPGAFPANNTVLAGSIVAPGLAGSSWRFSCCTAGMTRSIIISAFPPWPANSIASASTRPRSKRLSTFSAVRRSLGRGAISFARIIRARSRRTRQAIGKPGLCQWLAIKIARGGADGRFPRRLAGRTGSLS